MKSYLIPAKEFIEGPGHMEGYKSMVQNELSVEPVTNIINIYGTIDDLETELRDRGYDTKPGLVGHRGEDLAAVKTEGGMQRHIKAWGRGDMVYATAHEERSPYSMMNDPVGIVLDHALPGQGDYETGTHNFVEDMKAA